MLSGCFLRRLKQNGQIGEKRLPSPRVPGFGPSASEADHMSMKNRRSNREQKKPKQNKPKVAVSTSPFAAANANQTKGGASKRK